MSFRTNQAQVARIALFGLTSVQKTTVFRTVVYWAAATAHLMARAATARHVGD